MNFDPKKFSIGVIDLFSVLLPGATLVYLAKDTALGTAILARTSTSTDSWIVFAFASYLVGHLIFLLGAEIDELLYDPLRNTTYRQQINRMAGKEKKSLAPRWIRNITRNWLFGRDPDEALAQAIRIKNAALAPLSAVKAINAFQWCKARLSKEHPSGLAMVQRFEADSKFFRSFAVALAILVLVYASKGQSGAAALCALLVLPTLWRYIDQRFKSTQQAFWLVITLEAANKDGIRFAESARGGVTHAGGVVYRGSEPAKYLIVQARKKPGEWVLPKGHIEPGEDPAATAVREVEEETGHWARVETEIGDYRLGEGADAPFTRFYRMILVEERKERDDLINYRKQNWVTPQDAEELPGDGKVHKETLDVLRDAEKLANEKVFDR